MDRRKQANRAREGPHDAVLVLVLVGPEDADGEHAVETCFAPAVSAKVARAEQDALVAYA